MHTTLSNLMLYKDAYDIKRKMIDEISYMMGVYNFRGFQTVIHNFSLGFSGKTNEQPSKYLEKPFLMNKIEKDIEDMTDEELNKAIEAEILKEEAWIRNSRRKGLPETIIGR